MPRKLSSSRIRGGRLTKPTYTRKMPADQNMNPVISGILTTNPGENTPINRGELRNGNPSGDPTKSPRCNALTRSGTPCRCRAMWSERSRRDIRCYRHGGASTGPRTPAGAERCRKANLKHGRYTAATKAERRADRQRLQLLGARQFVVEQVLRFGE